MHLIICNRNTIHKGEGANDVFVSHMVEGVTLPILLHWSSIREMRGDTTTIALPPAADLPHILYSKQTEESGSILTPPGRCDDSHKKTSHRSIAGRCSSSIQERLAA